MLKEGTLPLGQVSYSMYSTQKKVHTRKIEYKKDLALTSMASCSDHEGVIQGTYPDGGSPPPFPT